MFLQRSPGVMAASDENAGARASVTMSSLSMAFAKYSLAAGTERARIARKPCHNSSQLIRPSNATRRILAAKRFHQMRLRINVRCSQSAITVRIGPPLDSRNMRTHVLGVDVTRTEGIHSDVLWSQFARHAVCHLDDSRLRAIVRHPCVILR